MNTHQAHQPLPYVAPPGSNLHGTSFTIPKPPEPPRSMGKVGKALIAAGITLAAAIPLVVSAVGINLAVSDYATANLTHHKFTSSTVSKMVPEFSPSIHSWAIKGVTEDGTVAYANADQTCELYVSSLAGAASHLSSVEAPYKGEDDKEATEQLIASLSGTTQQEVSEVLTEDTVSTPLGASVDVLTIDATNEGVASLARLFVGSNQGFTATVSCDTSAQAKSAWVDVVDESTVKLTHENSWLRQP